MKSVKSRMAATLIGGVIGLAAAHAGAATISFDDTAADETITVSACDFENGAFVNGVLLGLCGSGFGGSVTLSESSGTINFSGGWIDQGLSGTGTRTIYLVEAGTPTVISDIFTYSFVQSSANSANILIDFTSDLNGSLGSLPVGVDPADVFVENGQPVRFSLPFLTGQVHSSTDVPEPGSLALVGLGLAGAVFGRYRMR